MKKVNGKIYLKVGEDYTLINGNSIVPVAERATCEDCAFYRGYGVFSFGCSRFSCDSNVREDRTDVIFKRVINQ